MAKGSGVKEDPKDRERVNFLDFTALSSNPLYLVGIVITPKFLCGVNISISFGTIICWHFLHV
jgi:hypothetical protein